MNNFPAFFSIFIGTVFFSHTAIAQKLQIHVDNASKKGTIYIALYNTATTWAKPHDAFKKWTIAQGTNPVFTSPQLPPGEYAIAIYQDINGNKKIDKNWVGIPTEPFAFSNNVRPVVSAPTFKQCKFSLGEKDVTLHIKLETYL